jgi:serine protease inhibitor
MKRNGKFNYTEIESLNSKLLELPYSGDDLSLYIVLPNEKQVFTSAAGLSEIHDKKDLKVSKVIHKTVVEVNEEGNEAAVATAIVIK